MFTFITSARRIHLLSVRHQPWFYRQKKTKITNNKSQLTNIKNKSTSWFCLGCCPGVCAGGHSVERSFADSCNANLKQRRRDNPWLSRRLWGEKDLMARGVRDHLHWLCHSLVTESQSLRINFTSGILIIFNRPAETKGERVIDTTSTDSTRGGGVAPLLISSSNSIDRWI